MFIIAQYADKCRDRKKFPFVLHSKSNLEIREIKELLFYCGRAHRKNLNIMDFVKQKSLEINDYHQCERKTRTASTWK